MAVRSIEVTRNPVMVCARLSMTALVAGVVFWTGPALAQAPSPGDETRAGLIEAQQVEKAKVLRPPEPTRAEAILKEVEDLFMSTTLHWHPFFENAYQGSGITGGVGYLTYLGPFNTLDLRGSITANGSKRAEAEFRAPRLLGRRARFIAIGGWREATRVNFFGLGTAETSTDDRTAYSFRQPYASAVLDIRPTRGALRIGVGLEYSRWEQRGGGGSSPSVEEVYTPDELPGLGARPTYLQSHGTLGLDWRRPGAGYARRGGAYAVTLRDYADQDGPHSFRQVDYDVVQHVPILRDAWVLSLRGRAETTYASGGQSIPFFMMPALGSGSTLRGYQSWRFRDRNSLLLSAEWRVLVNSFIDTAVFYDAGKVTARRADLDLRGLKGNVGFGIRLHGLATTPVRIELARGNEGLILVFGASAAF